MPDSEPVTGPRALMIQGTGSDAGKSLLVTGLARAYRLRGLAVRPFKPQNMSNNAAVTKDGGEIGRAQALQARAAGVAPTVHMNPVLLKPQSETGAQVIVQGRVEGTAQARDYHALKPELLPRVMESFAIVADGADLVLCEGAGSPAEVNLRSGDIANMGFAEAAGVPVALVADIERGGVIASLVGTMALLSASERACVKGCIINKFRGDPALFAGALGTIREKAGLDCFGIVPFFEAARLLPQEDAMSLAGANETGGAGRNSGGDGAGASIRVAVPRLSRIANFDDLDPLSAEPGVAVEFIEPGSPIPGDADLVIIPGSKSTLADLGLIRAEGWDVDIQAHARRGGLVIGLCGGYQILGTHLSDPDGIEGPPSDAPSAAPLDAPGLGLLDVETVIEGGKTLSEATGTEIKTGETVKGYEMHIGRTTGPGLDRPFLNLQGDRPEGAVSADGRVMGTYLHGLFAADGFRHAFLSSLRGGGFEGVAYETQIEETLDALAAHLEEHLDLDALLATASPVDLGAFSSIS